MIVLLDTSALGKLLIEEPESSSLRNYLTQDTTPARTFVISSLAVTELRRLAFRLALEQPLADEVLRPFTTLRLTEAVLQLAGRLPHRNLGTLHALHIGTALIVEARVFVTYDARQAAAAAAEGLLVDSPGTA